MIGKMRLSGGQINRDKILNFTFNDRPMMGYQGDTLASALLANGQRLVGRSFKYHRPRGVFSAGSEEPNALVQLRKGAFQEPNTRATTTELFEGLIAHSQNHRGSLENDLMGGIDLLSPFLGAGFYYKTFMWPKAFWEKIYEPFIRASAGLGRLAEAADPDFYDKGFLHCDVLIIGAGPAGLSAALFAARAGAQVILADEDALLGGRLGSETMSVNDQSGVDWAVGVEAELASMDNVRLMTRTTVFGAYDHGVYGAIEKHTDHLPCTNGKPRQIYWKIFSKRAILCAGATERSMAFGNNDRPGIMLAGAVRAYANRWAVAAGQKVAVFTNNDDGWRTAVDLVAKNVEVAAVIDSRDIAPLAHVPGALIATNTAVRDTMGRKGLQKIILTNGQEIQADCLAVAGGWNPNVHLTCHQRGRPEWHDTMACFVPGKTLPVGMSVAGAANGSFGLSACLVEGRSVANSVVRDLGLLPSRKAAAKAQDEASAITPLWHIDAGKSRCWIDLQNDVTGKDVKQAHSEGFRSVEHLKRYTTLGMATDQGKTANVLGLAVLAEVQGSSIPETGTTIFRPPFVPVSFGAMAGRARGKEFRPTRLTPSHKWAEQQNASFTEAGQWLRPEYFSRNGEASWRESVDREVLATRRSVGLCDVSSLGKIDIQGRDAGAFLNKVYCNGFAKLPVGKVRYGLMLREDGVVMDDGTTARLAENQYVMTTTTANAGPVYRHLDFARQCLWPQMDVHIISVTDGWAQIAVAGPKSRDLLGKIIDAGADLSNAAFPFMACAEITVCGGIPARLFRISFSGELAYEIAVPSRFGDGLMRALMDAGQEFNVTPYGLEALNVMRIEMGHVTGSELNGQTTARDLGMDRMVSQKKDSIGTILSRRPELMREDGLVLMGLQPVDRGATLSAGAHFLAVGAGPDLDNDLGWMTSVAHSPTLGHAIGLGFIRDGSAYQGKVLRAWDAMRKTDIEVEVVSPHFVDPEGVRVSG